MRVRNQRKKRRKKSKQLMSGGTNLPNPNFFCLMVQLLFVAPRLKFCYVQAFKKKIFMLLCTPVEFL